MGSDRDPTRPLDQQSDIGSYRNGKTEFQDFSRTFFIFQTLNFFPILYKTTWKNALFQPEMSKKKGAPVFFDPDSGDKKRNYRTN